MRQITTNFDTDAFMAGIEMAIDWNLYIPPEDFALYNRLIEEREQRRSNKGKMAAGQEERG